MPNLSYVEPITNIVPKPKSTILQTDFVDLKEFCWITSVDFQLDEVIQEFSNQWNLLGWSQPLERRQKSNNSFGISLSLDSNLETNQYSLEIKTSLIQLRAESRESLIVGLQTILQIASLSDGVCSCAIIEDQAASKYRGILLDVSRHFRPASEIKALLRIMAFYKLNHFHWHLVDDQGWRIPIPGYPKLQSVGACRVGTVTGHTLNPSSEVAKKVHEGCYTQEELTDIVHLADSLGITIIPEIDLPGHSSALLAAYPELACESNCGDKSVKTHFGIFKNVLCNKDAVFDFLEIVFKQLATIFPGQYIHIGGDEVKKEYWETCPDCQEIMQQNGIESIGQLHGHFIKRVTGILAKFNRKAICWDDVLVDNDICEDVLIMSWLGAESAQNALANGNQVVMTQSQLYFDFYPSLSTEEPMSIHGHAPLKDVYFYDFDRENPNILGAQANVWSEYLPTRDRLEYALFPRLLALSEMLWTAEDHKDWPNFLVRLNTHSSYLRSLGINVSDSHLSPTFEINWPTNSQCELLINSDFPALTVSYKSNTASSPDIWIDYTKPIIIEERTTIYARFFNNLKEPVGMPVSINVCPHFAISKNISVKTQNGEQLDQNPSVLTNGLTQQQQIFQHDKWFALEETGPYLITIDLESSQTLSELSIGTDGALGRELYRPVSLTASVSIDNKVWSATETLIYDQERQRFLLEMHQRSGRYIKVEVSNNQKTYSFEDERMVNPIVYLDEVVVN